MAQRSHLLPLSVCPDSELHRQDFLWRQQAEADQYTINTSAPRFALYRSSVTRPQANVVANVWKPAVPFAINNVVTHAHFGVKTPVRLHIGAMHGYTGTNGFPSGSIAIKELGQAKLSLFKTGQIVVTGSKTIAKALLLMTMTSVVMRRKTGVRARVYNFHATNVVANGHTGFAVDAASGDALNLDLFNLDHKMPSREKLHCGSKWTPDQFVGCRFQIWDPLNPDRKMVFVLFPSGPIVATGMHSHAEVEDANYRLSMLLKYQAGHEYRALGADVPRVIRKRKRGAIARGDGGDNNTPEAVSRRITAEAHARPPRALVRRPTFHSSRRKTK